MKNVFNILLGFLLLVMGVLVNATHTLPGNSVTDSEANALVAGAIIQGKCISTGACNGSAGVCPSGVSCGSSNLSSCGSYSGADNQTCKALNASEYLCDDSLPLQICARMNTRCSDEKGLRCNCIQKGTYYNVGSRSVCQSTKTRLFEKRQTSYIPV